MRLRDKLLALAVFAAVMVTTSAASAQGVQLFAVLNGGNEVTNDGEAAAGDLNGFGAATVIFAGLGRLCYGLVVHRISAPTAAHIHDGRAAVNGPIVITLTASNAGNPGAIGGCISGLDNALLRKIQKTPGEFYVNVHNEQFPGGAIRGQLQ